MSANGRGLVATFLGVVALGAGSVLSGAYGDIRPLELSLRIAAFVLSSGLAVASVLYLVRGEDALDWMATAAGKLALFATTLGLGASSLRYRQSSESWWAWDVPGAMLLVLWLCLISYFLLRGATESRDRAARFAAVFATVTAVDAPFLYLGVRSFTDRLPLGLTQDGSGVGLNAGSLMLILGLLLSFSAGMFYLYGSERTRRMRVSAPMSSPASTE